MVDIDTFLTALYVMADDFCKANMPAERYAQGKAWSRPGSAPSLHPSEVVCLALFSHFGRFASQRDFYRYAAKHLRSAFPTLPHRTQFNRVLRFCYRLIAAFAVHLARLLGASQSLYEVLDSSALPTRNYKRRGVGWLREYTNIGWNGRLGWYEGFHLLISATATGVITGWGIGAASSAEQPLGESFFAARALHPRDRERELCSVGQAASGPYVADTGFAGEPNHKRWAQHYGAEVICPPHQASKTLKGKGRLQWSKQMRRWLAGVRQMAETVYDKLHNFFSLQKERAHDFTGFQCGLASTIGLHNFCIWLNTQLSRSHLQFADLLDW
jgi:hypothetical protein